MRVVQLDGFEQVHDYGVHWSDLLDMSKDNHIFLTLEWLETWWKHFGAERELLLLAVVDNEKILALAPLMASTYKLFGVQLRNVEFIGSPASDYHSFILIDDPSKCTRMILDYIREQTWDCVELKNIPDGSETAKELKANSRRPFKLKERDMDICSFIPLPESFEEYLQRLHRKSRQSFRRRERRLRSEHELDYESFSEIGLTLEKAMDTFFKLHQLRWQSRGYEGKFADPVFRSFHVDVAKRFDEKGWLRLLFLIIDGEPVSADYGFRYRQKLYAYLCGFDPRYSHYGVGTIGLLHSIEDSIKSGLKEFDMLRGEHSYKEYWATVARKTVEFSFIRWRPVSKAYEWLVRSNIMPSLSSRLRKRAISRKI